MDKAWIERHLIRMIKDYQDLSASTVPSLEHAPSTLEFSRYVGLNRPVVVRRQRGTEMAALSKWSDAYLMEQMAAKEIEISVSKG